MLADVEQVTAVLGHVSVENRLEAYRAMRGGNTAVPSFIDFVKEVNPKYQFYPHVKRLADVLQKVADGEITRLMVFMPPRHGKSELVSRLFSAYYLICHPDRWVGINSYAAELAYTFSRNARENYTRYGGQLSASSSAVKHWETNQGGGLWAAGVGGPITGKGFHLGIIDDPIKNAEEAHSQTVRDKQKDWYSSTFYTREEPSGAIVIIQTRWNEDDLSGWVLSQEREGEPENWHVVHYEAIKELKARDYPATCYVEPDGRLTGEALIPNRYPVEKLNKIKNRIGDYFFGALYQQSPRPYEGGIFKSTWFDIENGRNRFSVHDKKLINTTLQRFQFWDTALKDKKKNDPSMCITIDLTRNYTLILRDVWTDRIESAYLPEYIKEQASKWNRDHKLSEVVIEDKGSGTTSIQTIRMNAPEWLAQKVAEFTPFGSKEYRAKTASMWMPRDCFAIPYPDPSLDWYDDLLDEQRGQLFRFTSEGSIPHDEFIDCVSMAILYLEHYLSQGYYARLANREAYEAKRPSGMHSRIEKALREEGLK